MEHEVLVTHVNNTTGGFERDWKILNEGGLRNATKKELASFMGGIMVATRLSKITVDMVRDESSLTDNQKAEVVIACTRLLETLSVMLDNLAPEIERRKAGNHDR